MMNQTLIYPYNEILPKRSAHDVYIVQECAALARSGMDVTLLCGKGSLPPEELRAHYKVGSFPIHYLPIVRKNNLLRISWNLPFFFFTQRVIEKRRPDFVFLSVLKQGEYHLKRKVPQVRYVYEVHQLQHYPNSIGKTALFERERQMLRRADLITVTTEALKEILQSAPYSIEGPIVVIPLAVEAKPLPPPRRGEELCLGYVGQLYEEQGVDLLLAALAKTARVRLKVVGGKPKEIAALKSVAGRLGVLERVEFLGFIAPNALPSHLQDVDAFVAPFTGQGRMPYVAHTKLFEYAEWGRPFIAPDLPVVREHFEKGVIFFEVGNANSLAEAIEQMAEKKLQLQKEVGVYAGRFGWEKRAKDYLSIIPK